MMDTILPTNFCCPSFRQSPQNEVCINQRKKEGRKCDRNFQWIIVCTSLSSFSSSFHKNRGAMSGLWVMAKDLGEHWDLFWGNSSEGSQSPRYRAKDFCLGSSDLGARELEVMANYCGAKTRGLGQGYAKMKNPKTAKFRTSLISVA